MSAARTCRGWTASLTLAAAVAVSAAPAAAQRLHDAFATPSELLEAWVQLWTTYDLDRVGALFLADERVTYFSSEREGLIRGYDAVVEHHRGFGFEPGGSRRDAVIWVGDVVVTELPGAALVAAIWYFGDPDAPSGAQRGPMSLLAVREGGGYRIAHMHFATYATGEG